MKFKTPYNAKEFPKKGEVNNMPSETLPEQSMTISEIYNRYARGLPLESKVPIYQGEEQEFPDLQHLDLAEREEIILQHKQELEEIKQRQKKAEQRKKSERTQAQEGDQGQTGAQPQNKPIPMPPRRGAAGGDDKQDNPPKTS